MAIKNVDVRTARLEVKLTPAQKQQWEYAALQAGYTNLSNYVRVVVTTDVLKRVRS